MATTADKIKDVEAEMAKTQKNKATSFHLGQLKAKLAKLKRELLTPTTSGGGGGCKRYISIRKLHILTVLIAGFDVARTGVASVGFIGFPSVGKSTLMSKLTGQHSEGKHGGIYRCHHWLIQISRRIRIHNSDDSAGTSTIQWRCYTNVRSPWDYSRCKGWKGSRSSGHCRCEDMPSHLYCLRRQQALNG